MAGEPNLAKIHRPKHTRSKLVRLDTTKEYANRETKKAVDAIAVELNRPQKPVPQNELDLLRAAALGVTGQSQTCRYLLFLLVGADEPSGFQGEGLVEIRTLDRKLADSFLSVLEWWRGPTKSDTPLYDILREVEDKFPPK